MEAGGIGQGTGLNIAGSFIENIWNFYLSEKGMKFAVTHFHAFSCLHSIIVRNNKFKSSFS